MKRVRILLFTLLLFFVTSPCVYASSISIRSSSSSVNRGSSVTVTAVVSADSGIYTVAGSVYCSGAGVNNGIELNYEDLNTSSKSLSRSVKITPTQSGNITCKSQGVRLRELAKDGEYSLGDKSITISVTNNNSSGGTGTTKETKEEVKEKSSNNSLASLSVEGYELDPKFSKDTLEYKLTVDEKIESIKVSAKASDSEASVKGAGDIKLSPGTNTIEIKVTAENGNEKVYKIIVTVEDQHPIKVMLGSDEYIVVKKNNNLIDKLDEFEETTIKINNQDVIAYQNKKINVVLVILKDKDNKLGYYIYKDNSYEKYRFIKLSDISLQLVDFNGIIENYSKYKINIQNNDVDIYKIKDSHKVGLIYGTNIKTGNTGFYVYDENENTLSKYYDEEVKLYKEKLKTMKNYFMIFMGIVALIAVITIIGSLVYSKKKKSKYKIK